MKIAYVREISCYAVKETGVMESVQKYSVNSAGSGLTRTMVLRSTEPMVLFCEKGVMTV